jgi:hypothetical protein
MRRPRMSSSSPAPGDLRIGADPLSDQISGGAVNQCSRAVFVAVQLHVFGVWKIEVAGDVGSFICGADGKRLSTQRVFVVVLAGLAAQAAHFAKRRRPQTILLMTGAASPEDLDEQHPRVHHCDQQAKQDAGDQPVKPAAHAKHQRHSAD